MQQILVGIEKCLLTYKNDLHSIYPHKSLSKIKNKITKNATVYTKLIRKPNYWVASFIKENMSWKATFLNVKLIDWLIDWIYSIYYNGI